MHMTQCYLIAFVFFVFFCPLSNFGSEIYVLVDTVWAAFFFFNPAELICVVVNRNRPTS